MKPSCSQLLVGLLSSLTILLVNASDNQDKCQFSSYQSEASLKPGKEKLAPLIGKVYSSTGTIGEDTYNFRVGICTNPDEGSTGSNLAAVTQQRLKNGEPDEKDYHNIGSLKDTHIMSGSDWVVLEYHAGENYGGHCSSEAKQTVVVITCDPDVDDNKAEMVFMEEQRDKTKLCYYLFEMKHQAVCAKESSSSGLSIGSIFLIIFFTVASVYLLVGFLYSRFMLGSKGMEQIPNYAFWKDFGNLQADGCDLICRTAGHRRSGGFRGVGDDQLDGTEEIIRDENLLPM